MTASSMEDEDQKWLKWKSKDGKMGV